jgi:penicillin amidase
VAFTADVDAYVALTERKPARLPAEFLLFGTRPARWAADDAVGVAAKVRFA